MTHILAISGSLRKASFNTGLMRAAEQEAPDGVSLTGMTLHGIPLYDGDEEAANGLPEAVNAFKNAIDWASRGPNVFGGKPVAIIGASPGGFGTILGQNHWLPVIRTLGMRPWLEGRLMVSRAGDQFDAEGNLTDESTRERLSEFVAGFAAFAGP